MSSENLEEMAYDAGFSKQEGYGSIINTLVTGRVPFFYTYRKNGDVTLVNVLTFDPSDPKTAKLYEIDESKVWSNGLDLSRDEPFKEGRKAIEHLKQLKDKKIGSKSL